MGMRGTGSHDISVTDVFVPKARTFPMVPEFEPGSHYQGPLYRFPMVGIAATNIPTSMLGVARKAIDQVIELAQTKTPVASSGLLKERSSAQYKLAKAEAVLRSGRLLLYDTLNEAWQVCVAGKTQTIYPWASWREKFTSEPPVWFHDIFRKDGTPYRAEEAATIRRLTGKTK